jgi:hypothetical protein
MNKTVLKNLPDQITMPLLFMRNMKEKPETLVTILTEAATEPSGFLINIHLVGMF